MLAFCSRPREILAGGQTGADRAGLDVALELGIPCGGWCPRGRRAEDGPISARYPLVETAADGYGPRTFLNVSAASATVVFSLGPRLGPGSTLTRSWALSLQRPFLHVVRDAGAGVPEFAKWLETHRPVVLNIAGSRESTAPGIGEWVRQILRDTFLRSALGAAARPRIGAMVDWAGGSPGRPVEPFSPPKSAGGAAAAVSPEKFLVRAPHGWSAIPFA